MDVSQIMPSDDLEVYVRRENSSNPRQLVTIGAIRQAMVARGFNFIYLLASQNYSQPCYVIGAKTIPNNITELYLADNSYLDTRYPYTVGYSNTGDNDPRNWSYGNMFCLNYNGDTFQFVSGFERNCQSTSVSGVTYYYDSQANENCPNYVITTFTGNIYINYTPIISPSGGAGSGYIGNALVSNKKMVGYNVPLSVAESTKTESVEEASESPVSGKAKIGNGHARIKFLRDVT